jgi:hypothetical protein
MTMTASGPLSDGPPPDKWTKFSLLGLDSDAVLTMLNELAAQGYYTAAVSVQCSDGPYVFVGGYSK